MPPKTHPSGSPTPQHSGLANTHRQPPKTEFRITSHWHNPSQIPTLTPSINPYKIRTDIAGVRGAIQPIAPRGLNPNRHQAIAVIPIHRHG
jgi:hypothetical protein